MKTISNLLAIAEQATGQIETAFENDPSPEHAAELQDKVADAIELLNSMEAFLMADATMRMDAPSLPSGEEVQLLFGT